VMQRREAARLLNERQTNTRIVNAENAVNDDVDRLIKQAPSVIDEAGAAAIAERANQRLRTAGSTATITPQQIIELQGSVGLGEQHRNAFNLTRDRIRAARDQIKLESQQRQQSALQAERLAAQSARQEDQQAAATERQRVQQEGRMTYGSAFRRTGTNAALGSRNIADNMAGVDDVAEQVAPIYNAIVAYNPAKPETLAAVPAAYRVMAQNTNLFNAVSAFMNSYNAGTLNANSLRQARRVSELISGYQQTGEEPELKPVVVGGRTVSAGGNPSVAQPATPPAGGTGAGVITGSGVNLRSGPGTNYGTQGTASGTILNRRDVGGGWSAVIMSDGRQGFVNNQYIGQQ
jgi:hypothetical protein